MPLKGHFMENRNIGAPVVTVRRFFYSAMCGCLGIRDLVKQL